ncbi:acetylcholinesterase-1-like [Dermacentor albipictus]|uniref:acetylcholinesterase-1-like n=1 Tax=Dermacentor albipictus TaxID=60249 RepID=UPI0031FDA631
MARYSLCAWSLAAALVVGANFVPPVYSSNSEPIVSTSMGLVVGKRMTMKEANVDAFLGIPYATAPTGHLRFERPRPPATWNGTYRATKMPSPCWQTTLRFLDGAPLDYYSSASEDCLYVNVWRQSSICSGSTGCEAKRPVMVFIHGGGFTWGDSALFVYDMANFVSLSDVVFVTFNYRLSILGFLSSERPELSGNLGLWDQNLVLKWVRANIASFGGDPDEVTLMGQSAGGISVALHAVSPHSQGLFKRAVMMSGAPLSMILGSPHRGEGKFVNIVSTLGCYDFKRTLDDQLRDAVACLKRLDAHFIFKTLEGEDPMVQVFVPTFGDDFFPESPFSEDTWKNIPIKEILLGNVLNEGTLLLDNLEYASPRFRAILSADYRLAITLAMQPMFGISVSQARHIVEAYFGDPEIEHTQQQVRKLFSELLGDAVFDCPIQLMSELTSQQGMNTYRYLFAHRGSYSFWPEWMGVAHSEETMYMLGSLPFVNDTAHKIEAMAGVSAEMMMAKNYTTKEEKMMEHIVSAVSCFAKSGKPVIPHSNVDWPEYTIDNPQMLVLKPNNYTVIREMKRERCKFWKPLLYKSDDSLKTRKAPSTSAKPTKPSMRTSTKKKISGLGKENIASASPAIIHSSHVFTSMFLTCLLICF